MSLIVSLYAAVLFFILTPSILLRIPKSGSKWVVAAVHALVFGVIFYFTHKLVWRLGARLEGFEANSKEAGAPFVGAPAASPKPISASSSITDAISKALPGAHPAPLPSATPSISPAASP